MEENKQEKKEQEFTYVDNSNKNSHNRKEFNKDWIITLLLAIFLGTFGIHRFYNKKIGTGILMLITFGGFGLWQLIDIILIVTETFKNKSGHILKIRV
ncbi:MAG: hypothetical protein QG614_628 [Patescibacteria group bacterium]|nr:hypothetical protein [Patescibacteria group bacterium]